MNKAAAQELKQLQESAPLRMLRPEAVVDFAKDPETALHRYFTWDDDLAAQHYRLLQARQLIRVAVTIIEETQDEVRAYVSLTPDRADGKGYRATVDVLNDETLFRQLLTDAKAELNAFKRKYARLQAAGELSAVFEAIEVAAKVDPAEKKSTPRKHVAHV